MAEYTRFEIYIPVFYTVSEIDPQTGESIEIYHQSDEELITEFRDDTCDHFEGITQGNPSAGPTYKGWWKPKNSHQKASQQEKSQIYIDYSTVLFGLVKVHQTDQAIKHFQKWKGKFEAGLHQEVILVVYYPVRTIGDFF